MTYIATAPQSPPTLECPKCGKHSVVRHQETRYVCLSCSWEKDLSEKSKESLEKGDRSLSFILLMATALVLALAMQ